MPKRKTTIKSAAAKAAAYNRNAYWKSYKELQARANQAWEKFRDDVRKKASSRVLIQDHAHLLLLLGECNYMARECMRIASKSKKQR